jgi:hypothetical protein
MNSNQRNARWQKWESASFVLYAIAAVVLVATNAHELWVAGAYAKLAIFCIAALGTFVLILTTVRMRRAAPALFAAALLGVAWAVAFKW